MARIPLLSQPKKHNRAETRKGLGVSVFLTGWSRQTSPASFLQEMLSIHQILRKKLNRIRFIRIYDVYIEQL